MFNCKHNFRMDTLAGVLVIMSGVFIFVYTHTDPWSLVTILVKGLLALAFLTFIIQSIGKRIKQFISKYQSKTVQIDEKKPTYKKEQEAYTEKIQSDYKTKAEEYKERILKPREETKKKQKEEEFYRFLGPAWKGKGDTLGGDSREVTDDIRLQRLQENINEEYLQTVRQEQERAAKKRQRKKIVLPDEPEESNPECIQVILRSPLGQTLHRRFLSSDTLQVVMDYVTTLGFSQRRYTLCTSYPRQSLSDQRETTLRELSFTKRTILNIEELE